MKCAIEGCNEEFTPKTHNQLYCCQNHAREAREKRRKQHRPRTYPQHGRCTFCGSRFSRTHHLQKLCPKHTGISQHYKELTRSTYAHKQTTGARNQHLTIADLIDRGFIVYTTDTDCGPDCIILDDMGPRTIEIKTQAILNGYPLKTCPQVPTSYAELVAVRTCCTTLYYDNNTRQPTDLRPRQPTTP